MAGCQIHSKRHRAEHFYGVYSEDNAVIDVKVLIKSMLLLCKKYGVALHENEGVVDVKSEANGVMIVTSKAVYCAKKAILTPGPYANEMANYFNFQFNILFWNMAYAYYKIKDDSLEFPMWFQFDYPDEAFSSKLFYGFPPVKFGREGFVRLAVDWASHKFDDIKDRHYVPAAKDIKMTRAYIEKHMRGVSSSPIDMGTAIHPQLIDNLSVLDHMPSRYVNYHENIVMFFGGWAYKFVPLFGKICAQMAIEGGTNYDISELSMLRDGIIKSNLTKAA